MVTEITLVRAKLKDVNPKYTEDVKKKETAKSTIVGFKVSGDITINDGVLVMPKGSTDKEINDALAYHKKKLIYNRDRRLAQEIEEAKEEEK